MDVLQTEVLQVEISRLSLKPGDILVVRVAEYLITEELSAFFKKIIPDNRYIICPKGVEFTVLENVTIHDGG